MSDRRWFCAGAAAALSAALAGCSTFDAGPEAVYRRPAPRRIAGRTLERPDYDAVYGDYHGERFPIEAFDYRQVDPQFLRQMVQYSGPEAPGTIVVDPHSRYLYFVEVPGRATRYGVGVGREGFAWSGDAQINMKRDWPDWIPPAEMVARSPEIVAELQKTPRGRGVPGGTHSPLGARAMYLFGGGRDLGYRIHGTTEPETIGTNVSSGCIRMVNQDIANLYPRTSIGTQVVVLGA
jgi:lipoprotein-anchoring transpeptidase ErfK/SrfK